jgi:pilus assembly protein CpaC
VRSHKASLVLAALLAAIAVSGRADAQRRNGTRAATQEAAPDEINLAVGESRTVSARNVKNYTEGSPGVIDVKLTTDASSFVITGRQPGSTTLLLIFEGGSQQTITINVFSRPPAVVERELAQLLEGLDTLKVRRIGAHIVIEGRVENQVDLQRVQQVASLYPGQVQSLVTAGAPTVTTSGRGEEQQALVRIDFYFVQYDSTVNSQFGLGWPASITGAQGLTGLTAFDTVANAGLTPSATTLLTSLPLPRLDFAATHGWAKVLRHVTVVTNNGLSASVQNGGEQNFTVTQGLTVGIQKVSFGAEVTVQPTYSPDSQNLALKINAEISNLTPAANGSTLPSRATSKLNTEIGLKLGQGLVLSGIHVRSTTTSRTGIIGLSEIPILGLLFSSTATLEQDTEGAIFVVPSVITTAPTRTREMVDVALEKFRRFGGDVRGVNAFRPSPGEALDVPSGGK